MKNFYKILFFLLLFVSFNTQTTNATTVEEKPVYINGGDKGLLRELYSNLSSAISSQSDSINGICVFKFAISKDGTIDTETIELVRNTSLPEEYVIAAKEAIKKLGKFEPGKMNGMPKKVWFNLPVIYPIPLDKINSKE